ncbi:helix-turn-helix domain-containing protein [Thiorhodovibrio frisius]|uniref:HRDC domain-containing protein n=1 Tax=Thiorhodovibrio frisius TaxID=631362 RepID=H8Z6H1_9GAMM|nr:helix-turn-helix domain-containing protein [Thiorhodovibrio frisius]EIC19669.1 HRDC domain-containing protein [Thiorhodovibrio frisius]WPL20363.1 helicase-primase subunit BBLF4 [Thiorhodovibrio frisius]
MPIQNPQLQLAQAFVRDTNRSIFLTGKAGTGKTTFLHSLKADLPKRMVVTAPTGVAAINAGGVTLHSFFQLPFGPFVPGSEAQRQAAERRFNRQKRDIIASLDLLIIDEISMVRADLLDAVDFMLRRERATDAPFGGVQLLMIGDLHQLAPVVPDQDWAILRDFYSSGYFFSSRALAAMDVVPIELTHIYRQSDADFIALLNAVRDNRLDEAAMAQLNARYQPDFTPREADGYITLTTHNRAADQINDTRLRALAAKPREFEAEIEDDYPAHSYPTAATLTLKQGAQVMFVRNDSGEDKRYFNGKIGTVTRLERERILVRCPGDDGDITVEPATWENIRYNIDPDTKAITEEVIGKFTQYPLRLAWAITIHKSQGLTFERAIIDAAAAFSHGQVYVGLSRCKTLEGLVLSAPIPRHAVKTDQRVSHYVDEATRQPPTQGQLDAARIDYQQRLLRECWDFDQLGARLRRLLGLLRSNHRVIDLRCDGDAQAIESIDALEQQTMEEVVTVSTKFRRELQARFRADQIPEDDPDLQERLRKASAYFFGKLAEGLSPWLEAFEFETDNKALRKTLGQALEELRKLLTIKTACIASCREGFSAKTYLAALAKAKIDEPHLRSRPKKGSGAQTGHGKNDPLLEALRHWREQKQADEERTGETRYRILTRAVLREIAATRPDSLDALAAIRGIGMRTAERYGAEILQLVAQHPPPVAHQGPSGADPKTKVQPGDSRRLSYRLYSEGLGIAEIAAERSLKTTTIEGHLAHFIGTGELAVTDFVDQDKLARITTVFAEMGTEALTPVKEHLGDDVSYGELKMVQAHLTCEHGGQSNPVGATDRNAPSR